MSLFDRDHWREIGDALRGNKIRTALTAFGVFWGIFLLIVMMGTGNGLENGAEAGFSGIATNSMFLWSQRTSKPYLGLPIGRAHELSIDDADAVRQKVAGVDVVAPRCQLGGFGTGNNVSRGTKSGGFGVMGDLPDLQRVQTVPLVAGRFVNSIDVAERRKVAVIGTRVRELLFLPDEDPIGAELSIQGVLFTVVGLFRPLQTGQRGDEQAQTIHVPLTTFQQAFHYGREVGWLAIKSDDAVPASVTEELVLSFLRARHRVAPDDLRAFGTWSMEREFNKFNSVFVGIRFLVWIVGIGTLAAGVIGVSNIMLVIVRERTHEIGIRRAIGATPLGITGQIVLEALLLTTASGYVGLIAGMLVMDGTAAIAGTGSEFFLQPGVDLSTALKAILILVVAGAAAGLMPALRAVRFSTVEALRSQ